MQPLHQRKKRKKYIIYIIVILAFIIINPFNIFNSVRSIIMIPLAPLNASSFGLGLYFSEHTKMIFSIGTLYKQNQELQNRVRQLESQNAYLVDVKNENESLRKSISLLPREEFDVIGAEVILRNPTGGNQWIVINKGERDEVEVGDVVIVNEGVLVGSVDEVEHATARVRLITNPDNVVNVISARTNSEAIAYGNHGISVTVEDIEKTADVVTGDIFITSNVGNKYPRGLSVGKVQQIQTAQDNLFQTANILPLANFDKENFVFIIK